MNTAVRPVIFERLQNSLYLAAVAFVFYVPIGILLGLLAALRKNTWVDQTISVGSLAFIGLPEFVSGLILITIFSIELGWFPSQSNIAPDTIVHGGPARTSSCRPSPWPSPASPTSSA